MNHNHLKYFFFQMNRMPKLVFPLGLNIDVTGQCNLKCLHCYFQHQKQKKDLSVKEWIERIKEIKKAVPGILTVDWIGGEPLLRKEVIEQGMQYFSINKIITNGTIELPTWKNCAFFVSIDGTKKYHEQIRKKNIYDKIKKNINRNDIEVCLNFTINKKNAICLENFLKEWSSTKIRGVLLTFYTPIKGITEDLSMSWEQRDLVVEKILKLKKIYKDFILNTEEILESMKFKNAKSALNECIFRQRAFVSLDPSGQAKTPCSMGEKADCAKCGCVVPYFFPYFKNKKIEISPNYKKIFPSI